MVLSTQYFPSIMWVQTFLQQQHVQIEQWENYQKQGLMNRSKIMGAEGTITLSVPLSGGREQKALVKNAGINNSSRWYIDHIRAIKSCYSKAPFFDYYFEHIEQLLNQQHTNLLELNMKALQLLIRWFRWQGQLTLTDIYESSPTNPQSLIPGPQYIQVFSDRRPFAPGLSVLDILFCTGPQAKNLLLPQGSI